MLPQSSYDFTIMFVAVHPFGRNYQRGESETASGLNPASVSFVGNNDGDARIRDTPGRDIPGDGLEV
jgi:hypothetical protein